MFLAHGTLACGGVQFVIIGVLPSGIPPWTPPFTAPPSSPSAPTRAPPFLGTTSQAPHLRHHPFLNQYVLLCFHSVKELDSARESARIRTCYIMIALTLVGCLVMAISGKKAAREKSLSTRNLERRAKLQAESVPSD
uniref:Uncharacterized protein n=1 Tax=Eptatretus burgeri TaxID=7764 RepID=A0A8C4Q3I5_EPTBU